MEKEFNLGEKLPNWKLNPINKGETTPLIEEYIGKPLIIMFFSLQCPGCLGRSIPFANRIVYEHGTNINVIGIHSHFDGSEISSETLLKAKEEFHIRFPYYRDAGLAATFHKYKAGGTPHWIIVDANGIVKESLFGSDPNRALLKLDYIIDELKQ